MKSNAVWGGFVLIVLLSLLACQLPGQILNAVSRETTSPNPYPGSTEAAVPFPQPGFGPAYPQPGNDPAYPASGIQPTSTSSSAYPGQGVELPSPEPGSAYPEPGNGQLSPTATVVALLPTLITPAYPNPKSSPTPIVTIPAPSAPSTQGAYPGPGIFTPTTYSPGAYPDPVVSPTSTLFQAIITPSPTHSSTPVFAVSPTITSTSTPVIFQTATPTPTVVYYVTATPSLTPSPTTTRTQVPPPPWMSSQLRATDPSGVDFASGSVQLIMFFAFWSGPSQAMAPLIHALEEQYSGQMNFVYLDIDDPANDFFRKELGFKKEPHFFLLNEDGTILEQWIGYVSMGDFFEAFEIALP